MITHELGDERMNERELKHEICDALECWSRDGIDVSEWTRVLQDAVLFARCVLDADAEEERQDAVCIR